MPVSMHDEQNSNHKILNDNNNKNSAFQQMMGQAILGTPEQSGSSIPVWCIDLTGMKACNS